MRHIFTLAVHGIFFIVFHKLSDKYIVQRKQANQINRLENLRYQQNS